MILYNILKDHSIIIVKFLMVLFFNQTSHMHNCSSYAPSNSHASAAQNTSSLGALNQKLPLKMLNLEGYFEFNDIHHAATDFGNIYHSLPTAILYPASVSDISTTIQHVYKMGATSELTIAARGHGHSLHGQSQAKNGIIVSMKSLKRPKMHVHVGEQPYVDVSGGELWIDVLHETLNFGLAPKSWTDYLYLTVGGTLSNAGVSGQAFRHGPQIENVRQLEVVTGKGDEVICSEELNADLFYGALGGLGQFGIITRAKISLEPAPEMVKWIRVLYSDFNAFTKDQEHLISLENSFDYIEGFVIINRTGLLNNWRSSFNPKDPLRAHQFYSEGKTLYCLEMAKYFNPEDYDAMIEATEKLLSRLRYIQQTHFSSEVSYVDFLNRVHLSEQKLREKSLWDVPHPWLNLFIPRSRIHDFAEEVFANILKDTSNGPILIYPVNQSRWSHRNSMVTPEEDVFYLVAFLSSAVPSITGSHNLQHMLAINKKIKKFCDSAQPKVKEYLAHYNTQKEWRAHFGQKWEIFSQRKSRYDPLGILAPGQGIFQRQV